MLGSNLASTREIHRSYSLYSYKSTFVSFTKGLCQIGKFVFFPKNTNMSSTPIDSRRGFLSTFLNWVEKAGNRLPDPLILYFGLAMLIPVLSWLISFIGWSRVHPVTGETIGLINLLTSEQIQRIFVEAENNFTSFPPLGAVLVTMLGIGVAERSGLIGTSLKLLVEATPRSLISVVVVFAGVMSSMAADAGYVVLTPSGLCSSRAWADTHWLACAPRSQEREAAFLPISSSHRSILCFRVSPNRQLNCTIPSEP